ncbi:GH3 auxin-responsive promoter family protein [Bacteroidales bacterium OttesenSCG-928-J19]|nr:GH3 auxin-responsive promoter family protein [Bacteroidales bacterium OttesenSCG-928-J19]
MGIIHTIARKYFTPYREEIDYFIEKPHQIQEKVFRYLLESGKQTQYGKEHGFDKIRTQEEFSRQVPIMRYEELKPYIEQIICDKKKNVLWNKPVRWFAMSSGTTKDKSKYIPVTKESLKDSHYKCGKHMISLYLNAYPESDFYLGKTMVLGGSKQMNLIGDDIFTGDVSAILMKHLPWWAKSRRTPERIALIPDWEAKFEKLVNYGLKSDIRAMMGVPSWMLVLLQKMEEKTGKTMAEIWPNIDVFFHGGVNFTPYEEQYKQLFKGSGIHFWETYNASEGFFGIQYEKEKRDMLLMLDNNIYYEFLPINQMDAERPQTIPLSEVKTGVNYALIISTNGGLWRYQIGDTIEFTSTSPYLFKITGRTSHFINAFGEELVVENADNAMKAAAQKTQSVVSEYTAAPLFFTSESGGAHEWLIEFENPPADVDRFADILDQELKALNSDYEAKRSYNLSLRKPIIRLLPVGTFYEWMRSKNKLGGQNKVPRLANNRVYVEEILSFLKKA